MNTVSDRVVRHSLTYLSVQKWITVRIPYYIKIWLQLINPVQKTPISSQYSLIAPEP